MSTALKAIAKVQVCHQHTSTLEGTETRHEQKEAWKQLYLDSSDDEPPSKVISETRSTDEQTAVSATQGPLGDEPSRCGEVEIVAPPIAALPATPRFPLEYLKSIEIRSSGACEFKIDRRLIDSFPGPFNGQGTRWSAGDLELQGGHVKLPERIAACLRPYQRDGVAWLYERLFAARQGCLLCDEMGLGKTVQVACCLVAGLFCQSEESTVSGPRPVLVLCPPSLCKNWEMELRCWGPFSVELLSTSKLTRALHRVKAGLVHVVIASVGLLAKGSDDVAVQLKNTPWECVVVDEIHQAKNVKSQLHRALSEFRALSKLGLTGTPFQNSLADVWALLRVVGAHNGLNAHEFMTRFGRPIVHGQNRMASAMELMVREDALVEFHKMFNGSCLRRCKDDVALMLPGKNDRVVPCPLSDVQRIAYENLLASPDFQLVLGKRSLCMCGSGGRCLCGVGPVWHYVHSRQAAQKGLEDSWAAANACSCRCQTPPRCLCLALITLLQRCANHTELMKPDLRPPRDTADEAHQHMMQQICRIAFAGIEHKLCSNEAVSNLQLLGSSDACGKMQVLLPLLQHWRRQGQKILVYSGSTHLLDILQACLWQQGMSPQVLRLDGHTPPRQRQGLVDEFNSSSTRGVFLISTRAGGVGLNLTSASVVVIFDPDWNPFSDLQAQDRSFRIGQTRVVEVYRLLGEGTIEEHVYVRQVWKQQLAATAIDGTRGARCLDGAALGIKRLFELHSSSMLPSLMHAAFRTRSKHCMRLDSGISIFEDVRKEPARNSCTDADGEASDNRTANEEKHMCIQPDDAGLEFLHSRFDQLDHSMLLRHDPQEKMLISNLQEEEQSRIAQEERGRGEGDLASKQEEPEVRKRPAKRGCKKEDKKSEKRGSKRKGRSQGSKGLEDRADENDVGRLEEIVVDLSDHHATNRKRPASSKGLGRGKPQTQERKTDPKSQLRQCLQVDLS